MIIRVDHENHYTVIRNKTLRDSRLSFRARGLLAYLLSLPDETRVSRDTLAKVGPDGERAIRNALQELTAAGYLTRERVRQPNGRLVTETTLRERPVGAKDAGEVTAGALRPSGSRPSGKRPSLRSNKEGAPAAGAATPPEYLCAACGAVATAMAADATWWCGEHRAEYHDHSRLRVVEQ